MFVTQSDYKQKVLKRSRPASCADYKWNASFRVVTGSSEKRKERHPLHFKYFTATSQANALKALSIKVIHRDLSVQTQLLLHKIKM